VRVRDYFADGDDMVLSRKALNPGQIALPIAGGQINARL
jgi:hypothetical protein